MNHIKTMKLALEALEYPLETPNTIFDADKAELLNHRAATALRQAIKKDRYNGGCGHKLADDQWWKFCGETDMGQTAPALCEKCEKGGFKLKEPVVEESTPDNYREMYLKVRDELAALQQSRAPLTSKEIRAIEVDVATNLSLDYPSPAEQFTRAIEARHGVK
jgi:hypothetical protein